MAELDVETQLELHRMEMGKLLPHARRECESDENRSHMLDTVEGMLDARHRRPLVRGKATQEYQEAGHPMSPETAPPEEMPGSRERLAEPVHPPAAAGAAFDEGTSLRWYSTHSTTRHPSFAQAGRSIPGICL